MTKTIVMFEKHSSGETTAWYYCGGGRWDTVKGYAVRLTLAEATDIVDDMRYNGEKNVFVS